MNLREQLKEILPKILPKSPAESIKGTKLIELVKHQMQQDYSDATLRYHFSVMSCDPTSPIAKVDQGQGYFLRSHRHDPMRSVQPRLRQESLQGFEHGGATESPEQLWMKFQAFYERYRDEDTSFTFPIRHEDMQDTPNSHFWMVPDGVIVKWKSAQLSESGVKLVPEMLCLEEPSFTLTSVKMAVAVDAGNYRRTFFQTLSNGMWAHAQEFVIATEILDDFVVEDLRKLGQRHGVGISYFALTEDQLADWDVPEGIQSLPPDEFDRALRDTVVAHRICAPVPRQQLDWDHLNQLNTKYPGFDDLFRWIHYCLMRKHVCTFADFEKISYSPG